MSPWKEQDDPLFRGDSVAIIEPPQPWADPSLVRHILQLDGPGQEAPYLSTTESEQTARQFALPAGFVHGTVVPLVRTARIGYRGRLELLQLLVGTGKGKAHWHSPAEVKRAAQLVEQHAEHLLDVTLCEEAPQALRQTLQQVFTLRGRV